jgi:hypothetical protein
MTGLLRSSLFSDEAKFHVCGKVNSHTVRVWGRENVDAVLVEHVRDSSKANVV